MTEDGGQHFCRIPSRVPTARHPLGWRRRGAAASPRSCSARRHSSRCSAHPDSVRPPHFGICPEGSGGDTASDPDPPGPRRIRPDVLRTAALTVGAVVGPRQPSSSTRRAPRAITPSGRRTAKSTSTMRPRRGWPLSRRPMPGPPGAHPPPGDPRDVVPRLSSLAAYLADRGRAHHLARGGLALLARGSGHPLPAPARRPRRRSRTAPRARSREPGQPDERHLGAHVRRVLHVAAHASDHRRDPLAPPTRSWGRPRRRSPCSTSPWRRTCYGPVATREPRPLSARTASVSCSRGSHI